MALDLERGNFLLNDDIYKAGVRTWQRSQAVLIQMFRFWLDKCGRHMQKNVESWQVWPIVIK